MNTNRILLALDYASIASGGGGGGGGYGGDQTSKVSSGGTNRAAFGAINFGDNSSLGGASADGSDGATGGNNTILYLGLAALAVLILLKR